MTMEIDRIEINIGIFGPSCSGKSTLVNCMTKSQLSNTGSNKTTYIPQVYTDYYNNNFITEDIYQINIDKTIKYLAYPQILKSTVFNPIFHKTTGFWDFLNNDLAETVNDSDISQHVGEDFIRRAKPMIKINIWDMPGFDDTIDNDIYIKWLNTNIDVFDIIIYVTDINQCLDKFNTFNYMKQLITKYDFKMICLINKCDEMYFDPEIGKFSFDNYNDQDIYLKINNLVAQNISDINSQNYTITPFLPMTLLNNESSNRCIDNFRHILSNILISNISIFTSKHLIKCLDNIKNMPDIMRFLRVINKFNIIEFKNHDINLVWKKISNILIAHEYNIIRKSIMLCEKKLNYDDFDRVHSEIQEYLTFFTSIDLLENWPEYPTDLLKYHKTKLISNLLNIYDELCNSEYKGQPYICPSNLLVFLELIKTHVPQEFDRYVIKFISVHTDVKNFTESYERNLTVMIEYAKSNISQNYNINEYLASICQIIINKQYYIKNKSPNEYFIYLIQLKKLVKNIIKNTIKKENITINPLDILLEVIKKNISNYLSDSSFANLYRPELNMTNIDKCFNYFIHNDKIINLDFEKKLLTFYV
ncbi:hypothetical protein LBA_00773 [Megavirus lba]|uniref:Tr-type G domain-containing protein n=1 Tax=Megavirus lba TaxID=1235314 RepID=L7Y597_9VIRU|nr:hypothetical protein LBA_00773 [Megavirus lba]